MKHLHFYALVLIIAFCTAWKNESEIKLLRGNATPGSKPVNTTYTRLGRPAERANFSGEWKLNEAESTLDRKFPVCIFGEGDRANSKTFKVATHGDFLALTVARPLPYGRFVTGQEIVTFNDEESEATLVGSAREKSNAKWSEDGQTLTISSVKYFKPISDDPDIKVTEVWNLINNGNSMSVQINTTSISGENTIKLVYDKM